MITHARARAHDTHTHNLFNTLCPVEMVQDTPKDKLLQQIIVIQTSY